MLEELAEFNEQQLEDFRTVCNQLLSNTFVVRSLYVPDKGRVHNKYYNFLTIHAEVIREYLSLSNWDLYQDDVNGYFYVKNTNEANRLVLNKVQTGLLLSLRLFYEENLNQLGLEQDAVCSVRDLLEKVVTEHAILRNNPNMAEVKKALTIFAQHNLIQVLEGRLNQPTTKLAILPTIIAAVPSELLAQVAEGLRKDDEVEEAEENTLD